MSENAGVSKRGKCVRCGEFHLEPYAQENPPNDAELCVTALLAAREFQIQICEILLANRKQAEAERDRLAALVAGYSEEAHETYALMCRGSDDPEDESTVSFPLAAFDRIGDLLCAIKRGKPVGGKGK